MKFALDLPNLGPFGDARVLADLAQRAESAGWDGFFIWDHVFWRGWAWPHVDPWVALAAVALSTERIRLGTMVTPIPRRRPQKLARETVSIDHLSGGRLILGVGSGGSVTEFDNMGETEIPRERGARLDEGLEILTRLWSGQPVDYVGEHLKVTGATFLPVPVQLPRIPIWVAGNWPHKKPMRRAARYDGVFPQTRADRPG